MSKAEGETLEHFFTLLSTSEEAGAEDSKENFDNMRIKLQGQMSIDFIYRNNVSISLCVKKYCVYLHVLNCGLMKWLTSRLGEVQRYETSP